MAQLDRIKVPEHLKKLHKQKMIFLCYSRLKIIIPLIFLFCLYFLLRSLIINNTVPLKEARFQTVFDIISLSAALILVVFYFLLKPVSVRDVGIFQSVFQKVTGLLIIIWGAFVTQFFPDFSLGYTTFVICIFITCGLMLLELKYLITFCISGLLFLHIKMSVGTENLIASLPLREMFIVTSGIIVAIMINGLNRNSLTESFLLESELEEKVADRTQKLEQETEKAQLSDKMKTVFLANMSHEIRTPLNGILGFSNLLRDEKLKSETRRQYIDIVIKSGNTLLEILNEIIEVSRIEAGAVELFLEEFCLSDIIRDVVDGFRIHDKVQSGSINIVNETEGFKPVVVVSDRLKIIQILINLINNALKYTDSGNISCGLELSGGKVGIFIKDTGRGIDPTEQELIFERFRQVEQTPYNGKDGVGLGLTIVRGYVDMLKGKISLESEPDKGSEFRIDIPVNFHEA